MFQTRHFGHIFCKSTYFQCSELLPVLKFRRNAGFQIAPVFQILFCLLIRLFPTMYQLLQNNHWKEIWGQFFGTWSVWSPSSCVFSLDGPQRFVNATEGVGQNEKAAIFNVSLISPSRVGTDHLCHFNNAANSRENSFLVFRVWRITIAILVQMPSCCFEELW